jgi:streptogramin lyase
MSQYFPFFVHRLIPGKYLLWLTAFLQFPGLLSAQQPELVFHHLNQKNGLSFNIVNCFLKDSRGLVWIGTYNGLNRFDGAHFFHYFSQNDTISLPNNAVHCLMEDQQGNIWGGTDNCTFRWNRQTNTFRKYYIGTAEQSRECYNVRLSGEGEIWANSIGGLARYNPDKDRFEIIHIQNDSLNISWKNNLIRKNGMRFSPDGQLLWMATRAGLMCYDLAGKQLYDGKNNQGNPLFNGHSASALHATPYGHYWYYDNVDHAFVAFDPHTKTIKYRVTLPKHLLSGYGATLYEDRNHTLWFSTWSYKMMQIEYRDKPVFTPLKNEETVPTSIAGDFFWDAMEDSYGNLWLGTVGGISICNPGKSFYKVHPVGQTALNAKTVAIHAIADNPADGSWWISTDQPSVLQWFPHDQRFQVIDLQAIPPNKKGERPVSGVNNFTFIDGQLLMATPLGAWLYSAAKKRFVPFYLPAPYQDVPVKEAVCANDSVYYFSDNQQLYRWNRLSNTSTPIPFPHTEVEPNTTTFTDIGKNGDVWTACRNNWIATVNQDNLLIPREYNKDIQRTMAAAYASDLEVDDAGNVWITKKGDGLFFFNPTNGVAQHWLQQDGLVHDHVMAVATDQFGRSWSGAYNQFSVFNTATQSFHNFTLPISTNNFWYRNVIYRATNNHLLASVSGSIVEFFPERLSYDTVKTAPVISTADINGALHFLELGVPLQLRPSENNLKLSFGLITDAEAFPYDMLYTLEGADKGWHKAEQSYEAGYHSLPPGDYVFKVKSVAKDKSWESPVSTLAIHIDTPFYQTWWFITLLVLSVVGLVYAFYNYRFGQQQQLLELENKAQKLEKEKALVQYEGLKQQLNPHFLFNSLTSLNSLIMLHPRSAATFLENLSKTYRYILKSRDSETVALADEVRFAETYIKLQQTRFEKGFDVHIRVPEEMLHYKIVPVTLQNLLENAIKHNIIEEESPLKVDIYTEGDYLVIRNNLQTKSFVETSNKQGLANLKSLYAYLNDRPLTITADAGYFTVKIPLL